jgi:hypothetical protein
MLRAAGLALSLWLFSNSVQFAVAPPPNEACKPCFVLADAIAVVQSIVDGMRS